MSLRDRRLFNGAAVGGGGRGGPICFELALGKGHDFFSAVLIKEDISLYANMANREKNIQAE